MEKRRKLSYRKPTNRGGEQYATGIPKEFVDKMGITEADREIIISFDEETKEIKIRKA